MRTHRALTARFEDDEEMTDLIAMIEWLEEWGPTLRDIAAHPEKYPLPTKHRRGRPPKVPTNQTTPA